MRNIASLRGHAILDTGYWILVPGSALKFHPKANIWMRGRSESLSQALALHVALFLFIKSTEYLVYPVSSIQYPASLSITGTEFLSK
jgi:hypothetical protein